MTIKGFKTNFLHNLKSKYPTTEIDSFFFILMEEILDFKRIDTVLKADFIIPSDALIRLQNITKRLQNEEPIQYILGKTEFFGLPLFVDKNTLIPRPETEELVEWILLESKDERRKTKDKRQTEKLTILDIGTGTGCIPIALAKNLQNVQISAIDISKKAIEVAKKNAVLHKVTVSFFEVDILSVNSLNIITRKTKQSLSIEEITSSHTPRNDKHNVIANEVKQSLSNNEITSSHIPRNDKQNIIANEVKQSLNKSSKATNNDVKFDIIVSNPPYVRELEKVEINNNVLENEPHLALFVADHHPLIFYDKIADLAKKHLAKNGLLFFEINQYLGKETVDLLVKKGFTNIELKKDIFNNDRMVKASL